MSEPFSGMGKVWKNLRERRAAAISAELEVELEAAKDYYERTGRMFKHLSPTQKRKVIENWKEDHE